MTPARVVELALAAGDYVRQSLGPSFEGLDGSPESLAFVDHYITKVGNVSDQILDLVASAVGCYFGEVVIAHLGGTWSTEGDDPSGWTITLDAAPLRFRPVAMAAEAIRGEDLEDYDAAITAPSAYQETLADTLAASGPVEAAYYYSLTGRLETLEHSTEVLVELRRREEEGAPKPGEN